MFDPCDCGSGRVYLTCCGQVHSGKPAETAEKLMRARYTAFSRGMAPYLLKSWAFETRPAALNLDPQQIWTGLTVHDHRVTGLNEAFVRFTATWRYGDQSGSLSETSRFRRTAEGWVYVDGTVSDDGSQRP